jgi:ankyrin repeat protein
MKYKIATISVIFFLIFIFFGCVSKNLLQSARRGDIELTQQFIREGQDLNMEDKDGLTPLFHAAYRGHYDVVKTLIDGGAAINHVGNEKVGLRPLFAAVQQNRYEIVKALIEAGSDVNKEMFLGATPLIVSIGSRDKRIMRLLLDSGADPDHKNWKGQTAMQIAASLGKYDVAKVLCDFTTKAEESGCDQIKANELRYSEFISICRSPTHKQRITLKLIAKKADVKFDSRNCLSLYRALSGITYLTISNRDLEDISPLIFAVNLHALTLSMCSIKHIEPLGSLKKLKKLNLAFNRDCQLKYIIFLTLSFYNDIPLLSCS